MAQKAKTALSFEKSVAELEKIVAQMEQGDLPIEKSLDLYEKGIGLTKSCQEALEKAQLKIEELKVGNTDEE
jgi:exodeoxyribonuclease VII small subunit